jgi:Carboxypeptidase regulatory-like domain
MRVLGIRNFRRWLAVIAVAAGLTVGTTIFALDAFAASSTITGVVGDTSSTPIANVAVTVLDPSTDGTVASTTTANDGSFSVSVNSGIYNVQFIAPSSTGLQSYLATGVSTGGPPLTVVLKTATQVSVQGTLQDSEGHAYPASGGGSEVNFSSPLNPGTYVSVDGSGHYSTNLLADQNFSVAATTFMPGYINAFTLPVGTLDQDQTYNVVLPVSTLTISVRDGNGNPVTSGNIKFGNSSLSPLPGIPGSSAQAFNSAGTALNASGNVSLIVPNGITLQNLAVHLSNGLVLPFTLAAIAGDQHVFLIFSNGGLTVDQPPVVTGTPDRAPNANGWYNAPVTITWTSVAAPGSPGTPNTPPPVTLSTEGADQTVTSAKSCDSAGDCAVGNVTGLNLDMTVPSVSVTGVSSGTTYSTAPAPGCTTSDSLSGVASNATVAVTNSGTNYTATCSGAADKAGNQAALVSISYQVVPAGTTTASLSDSNGNPVSGAAVIFRPASGSATNATTGADGTATVTLAPGSYSVTMYYANGYQTKTISVTAAGPNTVAFATVAVTAQISDPDSADLASASIAQAGNTGTYGAKTPVDGNGKVVFQVLPGTNTFAAYDANGYQTKSVSVTGATTVSFATVTVTAQISDPDSADLATSSIAHAGNTGTYGPKTAVDANGQVSFQALPGTNSFTAYDANGYQTQKITVSGATTVSFATVAVTVTVLKNGAPLTTATVAHAGNTGTFGPKTPVDGNGVVVFQVLPGTNTFTAWDGSAYTTQTLTVTAAASTSISVS